MASGLKLFEQLCELKRVRGLSVDKPLTRLLFLDLGIEILKCESEGEIEDLFKRYLVRSIVLSVTGEWRWEFIPEDVKNRKVGVVHKLLEYSLRECFPDLAETLMPYCADAWYVPKSNAPGEGVLSRLMQLCETERSGYAQLELVKLSPFPRETEADHSYCVVLYAVILCLSRGESCVLPGLHAFFHHARCLAIPNSDHESDMVLGDLAEEIRVATYAQVLGELPAFISDLLKEALVKEQEGFYGSLNAFYECDILDRMLQLKYYTRIFNDLENNVITHYDFLNSGELKTFQIEILKKYELVLNNVSFA